MSKNIKATLAKIHELDVQGHSPLDEPMVELLAQLVPVAQKLARALHLAEQVSAAMAQMQSDMAIVKAQASEDYTYRSTIASRLEDQLRDIDS